MKTKMPIGRGTIDAEIKDFNSECELYVFSDTNDLLVYDHRKEGMEEETIFSMWVNCGKGLEKAIMFSIEMDELELFATSVLTQIKLIRDNYSDQIKRQSELGCNV